MAIYRGLGSAVSTTDETTIDQVAEDALAASTSATAAASSASSASSSASSASSSATSASTSATAAAASETAAAASETAAAASETAAAASETAAAASETAAAASETAAAASETAAAASETAAAASETAAAASEEAAATSETNAAASETAASTSATNAATSATAAAASATAAAASEDAALAALDNFDDRYLGQKTSDPSVDNDGDALVAGALYFNTTDTVMKVYDGSQWVAAYASVSGALIATNNLSDLVSASSARTNLGVAIGTDVQAYSSVLAATTASYTTAEETKLAGIEASATADQTAQEIATAIDADATAEATLKSALGLGTAAYTASTDYATAAQGALADSALQSIPDNYILNTGDTMTGALILNSTDALTLPVGTDAQRPTPVKGMFRFNDDSDSFEGYDGTAWGAVGGGGNTAVVGWENQITVAEDYTITTNNNMMSAGPITIDTGYSVTVPTGSTWTIV